MLKSTFVLLTLVCMILVSPARAEPAEKRIALVIGNGSYQTGALATAANDAGLIAQTLQAAGFDVAGARDLDDELLRRALRDFVDKASGSGPDTVAFVYFAGYGVQLQGENYLLPVDANITRDVDVPVKGVRITDYMRSLSALRLKATIVVLDAARTAPLTLSGQPLASGLALVDPQPGMLFAFNAAPGTVATESREGYGPYAKSLAEMIREAGLPLGDVFDRVRLRVNELTKGAQVPWNASKVGADVVFFARAPDAPAPVASIEQTSALRTKPIRDFDAQEAYLAALDRDTIQGYEEFLAAYPDDPMAGRVRALIAARREAITWRRTFEADTPEAYWSYLRRYRRGPHAADARRRLAQLTVALEPPPSFADIDYDVPPPPPDEMLYVDRPVLFLGDPDFGFAPPPPPPDYYLPPPPPEFVMLEPPPLPIAVFVLPIPVFVPLPIWCAPPIYVAPPPPNIIYANIHNTVIVNNTTNIVTVKNQGGQIVSTQPITPTGLRPGTAAPAIGAALPPAMVHRAALIQQQKGSGAGPAPLGQPAARLPLGQPLPGTTGRPLPPMGGKPATIQGPAAPAAPLSRTTTISPPPGTNSRPGVAAKTLTPALQTPRQQVGPAGVGRTPPPAVVHNQYQSSTTTHRPPPPTPSVSSKPPSMQANRSLPPARTFGPSSNVPRTPAVAPPPLHRSPPPVQTYRAPPPPVHTYRPPPPPQQAYRPPPAQAYRPPPAPVQTYHPPAPAYRPPAAPAYHPPPAAAYRAPPPAAAARKSCQVVNGQQVCK